MHPCKPATTAFLAVAGLSLLATALPAQVRDPDRYVGYSHYDIRLTFDDESKTFTGTERVRFTNTFPQPIDEIYFFMWNFGLEKNPYIDPIINDLGYVGGFHPSGTIVTEVADGEGRSLKFRFVPLTDYLRLHKYAEDRQLFYVRLLEPLAPGSETTVAIKFTVHLPNTYLVSTRLAEVPERWRYDDVVALRFGWYPLEANRRDSTWALERLSFPGHYVDQLELTVPQRYAVVLSGDEVRETRDGNVKTVRVVDGHPVRSKALAIAPDYRVLAAPTADGVRISVWYARAADESQARRLLEYSVEIVERYNALYGPTDYRRVDIVNAPFRTTRSGAADGMVLVGDGAFSTAQVLARGIFDRGYYYLCAHELAHLWAGVGADPDHYTENYLSEALAEYLSHAAFEAKYPGTANTYDTQRWTLGAYLLMLAVERPPTPATFRDWNLGEYVRYHRDAWDEPLVTPYDRSVWHTSVTREYQKGYMVLRTLEAHIGKSAFQAALRDYFTSYRHRFATTADLQAAAERASGKDLDAFFGDWVYTAGSTDYRIRGIRRAERDGEHVTTVEIGKRGEAVTPLEAELVLDGGGRQRVALAAVRRDTTVTVVTARRVRGAILDPDADILETNRMNNKTIDNLDFYVFGDARRLTRLRPLENYFVGLYPAPQLKPDSDRTEVGIGLQLLGRNYLGHRWQVGAAPVWEVRPDTGWSSPSYRAFGSITFLGSRDASLSLSSSYHGRHGLSARVEAWYPVFQRIEAGTYARVYHPAHQLRLALVRADSQQTAPLHYAAAEWTEDWILKHGLVGRLTLEGSARIAGVNDYQYVTGSVGLTKFIRITPILLVPSLRIGMGDRVPPSRRYRLQRGEAAMRGYNEPEDGDAYAHLSLDWAFPVVFGLKQNLLKLAVFRGLAAGVFVEAGDVWNRSVESLALGDLLDDAKINGGIEVCFVFTSIFDALIPLTLGYGHNLWSVKPGKLVDSGQFYVRFDTPVTLFAALFGY